MFIDRLGLVILQRPPQDADEYKECSKKNQPGGLINEEQSDHQGTQGCTQQHWPDTWPRKSKMYALPSTMNRQPTHLLPCFLFTIISAIASITMAFSSLVL